MIVTDITQNNKENSKLKKWHTIQFQHMYVCDIMTMQNIIDI